MLWTNLSYRHLQVLRQRFPLTPVAVCCVEDSGPRDQRRGKKLAVGFVKIVFRQFLEAPAIIAARRNQNSTHAGFVVPVIENMLEELVAHSRGTCKVKASFVFVEYETAVVNYNNLLTANVLQFLYTRQLALEVCVCAPSVRRDGNIGVYDIGLHREALIRRSRDDLLIVAISPISSPKNFSGQFSISPHSLSSRSSNWATP